MPGADPLKLHKVTWLMIATGVVLLLFFIYDLSQFLMAANDAAGGLSIEARHSLLYNLSWALGFFGTAAIIECLHRIHGLLRRAAGEDDV